MDSERDRVGTPARIEHEVGDRLHRDDAGSPRIAELPRPGRARPAFDRRERRRRRRVRVAIGGRRLQAVDGAHRDIH